MPHFVDHCNNIYIYIKREDETNLNDGSMKCSCKYKESFNNTHTPMIILDMKTGNIDDANLAACNYYLYSKEELLSMNIEDINILTKEVIFEEMNEAQSENRQFFRFKHLLSNGDIRDVEVYSGPMKIGNKDLLFSVIHDTRKRAELEENYIINKAYFDNLFNNSPEAIAIVDSEFRILNVNDRFKNIFQYDLLEIENEDITKVLCEQILYDTSYSFRNAISEGKFVKEEVKRKRKDGSILDVLLLGFPLVIDKEVVGAYFIYSDITESKAQESKIEILTYKDNLTGLFNRKFFLENIKYEISKNTDEKFAVIILKVNEFKETNDALGHLIGEGVLKEFGQRLKYSIGNEDIVARFSEDEFAVLIPKTKDSEEIIKLTDQIIKGFQNLVIIGKDEFKITTSMGISIYPDDGKEYITLIRKAEIAMNKSREFNLNGAIRFENSLDREIQEYFSMKNDLARCVLDQELFLDYQPIYDTSINKLVGVEALIRWNHKEKGVIPPLKFIPIVEKTGMIHSIGEWVLLNACNQNKKWQELGYEPMYVSVNVSILQLEKPGFSRIVKKILKESMMDPQYLQLEITETFFTQDYELIEETLKEFSKLGIKIAIDDFGTGYSSLGQLCELNINNLKIDRIFIDGVNLNMNKSKIVKAVISLAKSLNISLTAEGVETEEELNFLKRNGCSIVQGYLFSKPVGIYKIEGLLKKTKS